MKRAAAGILAAAAVCALLAGCSAADPSPASITAAQRKAATEADLTLRWESFSFGDPSLLRPKIAIVKYVNYLDEGPVLSACMHRAGYPHVSWTLAGGIVDTDVKPVNRFPVELAIYTCEAQYPSDPLELGYLSDAQEEYLYGYWSNETVPCLRAHGAVVANLPPVGEFGEGYEDVGALNPFTHLQATEERNEAYLAAECPPYPGELYAAHKLREAGGRRRVTERNVPRLVELWSEQAGKTLVTGGELLTHGPLRSGPRPFQ